MALEAPFHIQGVFLVHERHLVDLAMTGLTSYTLADMDVMLEVDEIGQIVDTCPTQCHIIPVTGADRLEDGSLGPNHRVTGHAGFGRGDTGKSRGFYRGVAVPAVDTHTSHMVFVTERDRLILRNSNLAYVI